MRLSWKFQADKNCSSHAFRGNTKCEFYGKYTHCKECCKITNAFCISTNAFCTNYKSLLYLWKYKNSLIPALNRKLHLLTANTKIHKRHKLNTQILQQDLHFYANVPSKEHYPCSTSYREKWLRKKFSTKQWRKESNLFFSKDTKIIDRPQYGITLLECLPFYKIGPSGAQYYFCFNLYFFKTKNH